jgi:RsiW-degrading membrane proteinase PrsW (M82 family)
MIVARAVAVACLTVLKWMLWLTGGLLLVLIAAQWLRAEPDADPLRVLLGAALCGGAGLLSAFMAQKFERL